MTPFQRRWAPWACVGLLAAAFAYFVWPTPWAYDAWTTPNGLGLLRRNRITNRVELIESRSEDGWEPFGDNSR